MTALRTVLTCDTYLLVTLYEYLLGGTPDRQTRQDDKVTLHRPPSAG